MEQTKEKLEVDLALLEKALATLKKALQEPPTDLIRDAVIQRFEYVFELSWKTMGIAADYMGTLCKSPREAIRTSFKLGWISNAEDWIEAMEARNLTSPRGVIFSGAMNVMDSAAVARLQLNLWLRSMTPRDSLRRKSGASFERSRCP